MKNMDNTLWDLNYHRLPPANRAKAGRGRIVSTYPSARKQRRMMQAQTRTAAKRQARVES